MGLFGNTRYEKQDMPFIVDDFTTDEPDCERSLIDIEAYGTVGNRQVFCYSSYSLKNISMYDNGDFEQLLNMLRHSNGKKVTVELKYKKDSLKGFKISVESLARIFEDDRFLQLELTGWGLNDVSCSVFREIN